MPSEIKPDDLPSVCDDLVETFDDYGATKQTVNEQLQPIEGSSQGDVDAGEDGEVQNRDYVGHVAYSPRHDSLVFQKEIEQRHLIHKIDGEGVAIDTQIVETLRDDYGVETVFVGLRETNNIILIPLDAFQIDVQEALGVTGWGSQLGASLQDAIGELPDEMSQLFTDPPYAVDDSITLSEVREKMNR